MFRSTLSSTVSQGGPCFYPTSEHFCSAFLLAARVFWVPSPEFRVSSFLCSCFCAFIDKLAAMFKLLLA